MLFSGRNRSSTYLIGLVLRGLFVLVDLFRCRGSVAVVVVVVVLALVVLCASMGVWLGTVGVGSVGVPTLVCVGLVVVGVRWSRVPGLVVGLAGLAGVTVDWFMVPPCGVVVGVVWAEAAVAAPSTRAAASKKFVFMGKEIVGETARPNPGAWSEQ